jgi:hypothetical protein
MDKHALAVLAEAQSWDWPSTRRIQQSGEQGGKYNVVTAKLLSCCIEESMAFPESTLLTQFWLEVGKCEKKLQRNSEFIFILLNNCYSNMELFYSPYAQSHAIWSTARIGDHTV